MLLCLLLLFLALFQRLGSKLRAGLSDIAKNTNDIHGELL